jgi:DNA-binding transcriptional MerR regulator
MNKTTEEHKLLEETGYSYSGIHNIISNEPEKKNELLKAIDKKYNQLKQELEKVLKKKNELESSLSLTVSSFVHYHKCMRQNGTLKEDKLSYSIDNKNIVVKINEKYNQIEYLSFERCDIETK